MENFWRVLLVSMLSAFAVSGGVEAATAKNGPPGYVMLCLLQPQECVGGGAAQMTATDSAISRMRQINTAVNRSIRPLEDGRIDVWTVNARAGDCEDYALTKRSRLIAAGFPANALRLAQVRLRDGRYHAVLVIITSQGDLVLDNLTNAIKPLSQTTYRVISMQTANPKRWT